MNVLVNGIGNIGQTVLALLIKYKDAANIDTIYAFKNIPRHFDDYTRLERAGVKLCFKKSEVPAEEIHFVFDCTSNGISKENKEWYETYPCLIGANAQGTEYHFGQSLMLGVNHEKAAEYKYQHIVSCNTHGILSLLKYYSPDFSNIKSADFVVVRRSEDLGSHERLVSANVVARHRDARYGTHHAQDANALLQSIGINIPLCSSDITTPSQLMHSVRFNIAFKDIPRKQGNSYVGKTKLFDSNKVFELGRRHGVQGRIYNHSIIVDNNLLEEPKSVKGWAFIPQEGNTVLSTIAGCLYRCKPKQEADALVAKFAEELCLFTN